MLDKKYQEQEDKQKMQAMVNRINRLEFEERRAGKLTELAVKKGEEFMDSR